MPFPLYILIPVSPLRVYLKFVKPVGITEDFATVNSQFEVDLLLVHRRPIS